MFVSFFSLLSTFVVLPFSRQFTHHFSSNCLQSSYFFPIKPDINFGMVHFKTKPKYRRRGDTQRKAHVYDNTQFDHEAIINSSWLEFFFLSLLLLLLLLDISCSSSFYFFGAIFIECMLLKAAYGMLVWCMSIFRYYENHSVE